MNAVAAAGHFQQGLQQLDQDDLPEPSVQAQAAVAGGHVMRDRDLAGHQIRREVLHRDLDVPQHEWSIAIPNLVRGLEVRHRVHVLEHVHETAAVLVHDLQAASELLTAFDDAGFQRLDVALDERERLA